MNNDGALMNMFIPSDVSSPFGKPRAKRDRPPSSYFESPDHFAVESPSKSPVCSPLLNRKPFKNFLDMKNKLSKTVAKSTAFFAGHASLEDAAADSDKTIEDPTDIDDDDKENYFSTSNILTAKLASTTNMSPTQNRSAIPNSAANRAIRRIHSMYQTTKERESLNMQDNSHLKNTSIPTFSLDNDLLPRIDEISMDRILLGHHNHEFDEFIIIDCRFNYEYDGGHIAGALNVSTKEDLERNFITNYSKSNKKQLLIFHCEFSLFRGPTMASHLRKCDRSVNRDAYPYLSYPDIVVLEGGYKNFFTKFKSKCSPQGYVEMKDINYEKNCDFQLNKARKDSKLTRAKSHNQFFSDHKQPFIHNRSQSYTTITNEKVLKRQKSNSKFNANNLRMETRLARASTFSNDQSIFTSSSPSTVTSPIFGQFQHNLNCFVDQDFQPPSASFKGSHRKSVSTTIFSSSSTSINSSASSICSDSGFSSTESLAYTSPMGEYSEFFDSKPNLMKHNNESISLLTSNDTPNNESTSVNSTNTTMHTKPTASVLKPVSRKPSGPIPSLPVRSMSNSGTSSNATTLGSNMTIGNTGNANTQAFKFPPKGSRHSLNKVNTSTIKILTPALHSSPIISSPLSTATPVSTVNSALSNNVSSIIDPINDAPVDFTVPFSTKRSYNHSRKPSGSLLSSAGGGLYSFISLDIDEAGEEDDEYCAREEDEDNERRIVSNAFLRNGTTFTG